MKSLISKQERAPDAHRISTPLRGATGIGMVRQHPKP